MAYIGQRPVIGRYIKLDQISSGFNGSNTGFSMTAGSQAVFPGTARNLLLSLGGVIQEPDTDFTISGSTLTFTTPPVANTTFFGVIYGDMQATGTPSDGTVLPASIASSGNFSFPEVTVTGDVTISSATPIINLTDTNNDSDYQIKNGNGDFNIKDVSNNSNRLSINSSGTVTIAQHMDVGAGLDITGGITGTTNLTIGSNNSIFAENNLRFKSAGDAFIDHNTTGQDIKFRVSNSSSLDTTPLTLNSDGHVDVTGNLDVGAGIDVTGSVNATTDITLASTTAGQSIFVKKDGTEAVKIGHIGTGNEGFIALKDGGTDTIVLHGDAPSGVSYFNAGNVGIGTTSPARKFVVTEATANRVVNITTGGSSGAFVAFLDSNTTDDSKCRVGSKGGNNLALRGDSHSFQDGAGSDKMHIDSSGNVMIGITSSPGGKLHVEDSGELNAYFVGNTSTSGTAIILQNKNTTANNFSGVYGADSGGQTTSQVLFYNADNDNNEGFMTFTTRPSGGTPTERMRIDSSGDVEIMQSKKLIFVFAGGSTHRASISGDSSDNFKITTGSSDTERFNINSSGKTKMTQDHSGQTEPILMLDRPSAASNAAVDMIHFDSGGQGRGKLVSASSDSGSPALSSRSDYRIKENIRDYTDGWDNIKAVPVKLFDVKTDGSKDQKGWIAHELQAVLPDLVQGTKDAVDEDGNPIYQSVSMGLFMPDVISALQAAIAKIETLETKVAALEAA